jgi:hypothetical protein
MDWWVILQVVVGVLITVGIVLFVTYFQKPKYKFTMNDAEYYGWRHDNCFANPHWRNLDWQL